MNPLFPKSRLLFCFLFTLLFVFPTLAQDTLVVEDFENGIPADWILQDGGNSTDTWYISTEVSGSLTSSYMRADSRAAGSGGVHLDESLITPEFDASSYALIYLSFDTRFNNQNFDHAMVEISTDGGSEWSTIIDWTYDYSHYPYTRNITENCAGSADVRIRFHYDDASQWAWYWGIDNVVVKGYELDTSGPVIEIVDYPLNIMDRQVVPITAEVVDDSEIDNVELNYGFWDYSLNRMMSPRVRQMLETGTPDQFFAEIDTNFTDALGTIAWYITADDTAGNTSRLPADEDEYFHTYVHDDSASYRVVHQTDFRWFEEPDDVNIICAGNDLCEYVSFAGVGHFAWYNEHYWGMYVCSNGFISFEDTSTTSIPQVLPDIAGPNSTIAVFMADLEGHFFGGEIKWWTVDNRYVVLEFDNVHRVNDMFASFNAQLVLDFETDYVFLYYDSFMFNVLEGEYVIGFEGPRGEIGELLFSDFTTQQPQDSMAYMIHIPSGYLEGVLTDQVTGATIANGKVGVNMADSSLTLYDTFTDEDGYYKLYAQPGLYDINYESVIYDSTYNRIIEDVIIAYDSTTYVDATVPDTVAILENYVIAATNSNPVNEARIECYGNYPDDLFLHLLTDENGHSSHIMYPGQFTFECWVPYYTEAILFDVIFAPDSTTTLNWVLDLGSRVEDEQSIPLEYELFQNYPNPFNPKTSIKFTLKNQQNVKLTVFDILGREIQTLIDKPLEAGIHNFDFNGTDLPSGLYFYSLKTQEFSSIKKMILMK